jgi:hypothetical protein
VLFVNVTRGDLREEFSMADEAFALSPISARAALPREEDYAAISEAFMETSRGRWFLGEYAKRNRNADTSMVLDAVARIEQSLAAQKEESLAAQREAADAQREAAAAVADNSLAEAKLVEALIAIRGALEAAQTSAMGAIDGLALNEKLAPVRKGARVIREIAWRLREIGNDGRICDLIDSQVAVIEQGAEQISSDDTRAALEAAFASLAGRIAEFGDEETAAPVVEAQAAAPAPAPQDEAPFGIAEAFEPATAPEVAETPVSTVSTEAVAQAAEALVIQADAALEEMPAAEMETAETVELAAEAADAHDEAVLDMIAMEMGAPDPFEDDEIADPVVEEMLLAEPIVEETHLAEPPAVEPEIVAELPEPMAAPVAPSVQPPRPPVAAAGPEPALEVSLGSSIIASGLVRRPVAANDPLAPIRRMSQAEKIAFFS